MKKMNKFFILFSILLVCALLNTIVFLTVDEARLDTSVFWLAWAFATPWTLLTVSALHLWASKGDATMKMPAVSYVCAIFGGIYLLLGAIFMYADVTAITFPLILELIVTVAYLVVAFYVCLAGHYITSTQKEVKQKVFFIRMLQTNVTSCLSMVTDPTVRAALEELSEKIRYSDPMSHASLAMVEGELASTIDEIASKLANADEDVVALIKKAEMQLARRNSQCLMLK
ncbi:MAG: hypothetical protein J6S04_00045 [Clostridia bacterium]|nr:hypothetical protein [Clostridia bacterium]